MVSSVAALGALVMLICSFRGASAQVDAKDQLKPEHLNLLIKISYTGIGPEIQRTKDAVKLSEKAAANRLFLSFD